MRGSQRESSCSRNPSMSTKHCRKKRSRLASVGRARKPIRVSANMGLGRRRHRPNVSTSASRRADRGGCRRSGPGSRLRADAPPARAGMHTCARRARRATRACARRRACPRPARPRGRAGQGQARDGSRRARGSRTHDSANSPGPCSSPTGGPSPLSSTAVEMPASSSRRSVTGIPASNRARASAAGRRELPSTTCCLSVSDMLPVGLSLLCRHHDLRSSDTDDDRRAELGRIARISQFASRSRVVISGHATRRSPADLPTIRGSPGGRRERTPAGP